MGWREMKITLSLLSGRFKLLGVNRNSQARMKQAITKQIFTIIKKKTDL